MILMRLFFGDMQGSLLDDCAPLAIRCPMTSYGHACIEFL